MLPSNTSYLTPLLALAAWMLGMSLLVQVVQELYKFVTSSKSRTYTSALKDLLGPWAEPLLKRFAFESANMTMRGPFQPRLPVGDPLPFGKDELISANERTAPAWVRAWLKTLDAEARTQAGTAADPSSKWQQFLAGLQMATADTQTAQDAKTWLADWQRLVGNPGKLDATTVRAAFRRKFLPKIDLIEDQLSQFARKYEFEYRRSLRQTFVLALAIAVPFNLRFQEIHHYAMALSPANALRSRTCVRNTSPARFAYNSAIRH